MFLASENIDFTGLAHVFLLGGGERCVLLFCIGAIKHRIIAGAGHAGRYVLCFSGCIFPRNAVYCEKTGEAANHMAEQKRHTKPDPFATLKIESLTPSEQARMLCRQMAENRISANTAVAALLRSYGLTQK